MEIFAQMLDDLDDLVCALPLLWERFRRAMLRIGLGAAISLPLVDLLDARWAVPLAALALTIAAGWLLALIASGAAQIRRQRV